MKYLHTLLVLALIVFSCANRGNLDGGLKDDQPPEILALVPESGSVNFDAEYIEFFFDENIRLNDLANNLIVSPPFPNNPQTKMKPKSFRLYLPDSLLANTTYTLNFGDAIQDLNENNPISGYSYVFSTGNAIDSLSFTGTVVDALTGESLDDAWVVLHENLADTAVIKDRPYYLTKVDETGNFKFDYLKNGTYNIFGIQDVNQNYKYDLPNEEAFAFLDTVVVISDSLSNLEAPLSFFVKEEKQGAFIKDLVNNKGGSFVLSLQGSTDSINLESPTEVSTEIEYTYFKSKDSVVYWVSKNFDRDFAVVSTYGEVIDTITQRYEKRPPIDTIIQLKPPSFSTYSHTYDVRFTAPYPVSSILDMEVGLLEDSLYVAGGLPLKIDSTNRNKLIADYPWNFGKRYDIEFLPGSFIDIYGNVNDTLRYSFNSLPKEKLSILNVTILGKAEDVQYIIQLRDGDRVSYERNIKPGENDSFTWENLLPKSYTIRVIEDTNSNGKWDAGDYSLRRQPERTINFQDRVELLADWEKDLQIELEF